MSNLPRSVSGRRLMAMLMLVSTRMMRSRMRSMVMMVVPVDVAACNFWFMCTLLIQTMCSSSGRWHQI